MTSVSGLLDAAGLVHDGAVRWGQRPSLFTPGVYLVATTSDPKDEIGESHAVVDPDAVTTLLRARTEATVDGHAATAESVRRRLEAIWVAGEPVVYIGLASTSVRDRVGQYYGTKIGARAPHAGGWPIKLLAGLDRLWVHYAAADDPDDAEQRLLRAFRDGLAAAVVAGLHDRDVVLPYANLELTKGLRKGHGFKGVKAPRAVSTATAPKATPLRAAEAATAPTPATPSAKLVTGSLLRTQNVTPTDIEAGRIRVPSAAKTLFPRDKATIEIELFGERLTCRWDPKYGPDKERSGTISVGRAVLSRLLTPGRQLAVTTADGVVRMGDPA